MSNSLFSKDLPTLSGNVSVSVSVSIVLAYIVTLGNQSAPPFPNITIYANTDGNASVDADAWREYNLRYSLTFIQFKLKFCMIKYWRIRWKTLDTGRCLTRVSVN